MRLTTLFLTATFLVSCTAQSIEQTQEVLAPTKEVIVTELAPAAIGPYSQAIKVDNTVWLAGQIALDPETGAMVTGGIEVETRQVMANIEAVLNASGLSLDNIVQAQVYLTDLNDYQAFNTLYAEYFSVSPPARAVIQAARLPRDAKVEIMVTAVKTL